MTTSLRVLVRFLFYRPLVVILLLLVYLVTALMLRVVDADKNALAIAAMSAFAAVGLSALLTERLSRYSFHAGMLGLPDHARVMRGVQSWFLLVFVATPMLVACVRGLPLLPSAALLCSAAAGGIVLSTYGAWWLALVLILSKSADFHSLIQTPGGQVAALGASSWLIWKWFSLPVRAERAGSLAASSLADAKHEPTDAEGARASGNDRPPSRSLEDMASVATMDLAASTGFTRALAFGLGYPVDMIWRPVLYGAAIAFSAMVAWHFLRASYSEIVPFAVVTGLCCIALVGRLQGILHRWMKTTLEQSLLRVTPRWPNDRLIKRTVVKSTFLVQRGAIIVWCAASAIPALLGWIERPVLFAGALALVGTSFAFTGSLWATLAHRRVREWHVSTIAIVIPVAAGAVTIALSDSLLSEGALAGLALLLIPPSLSLTWYWLAPLRLPVDVDARALTSPI